MGQIKSLTVTFRDIQEATKPDSTLSRVMEYIKMWWKTGVPEDINPFLQSWDELCIENGCLLWGTKVVIPKALQAKILHSLHDNHPGITSMKALARSYIWWIGLDKDIESLAKSCESYQAVKSNPTAAPLHPWVWPDTPWTRIHVDYAGPFLGN